MTKKLSEFDLRSYRTNLFFVISSHLSSSLGPQHREHHGNPAPVWQVVMSLAYSKICLNRDIHLRASMEKPKVNRTAPLLDSARFDTKFLHLQSA